MTSIVENTDLPFQRWSPSLVEELLFRRYIKKEDVTSLLPQSSLSGVGGVASGLSESYDRSAKMLFHYVRNGPLAALAPQNVNTTNSAPRPKAGESSYRMPPGPGEAKRKGNLSASRPLSPSAPCDGQEHRQLQKSADGHFSHGAEQNTTAAAKAGNTPQSKEIPSKRIRIEWPAEIPTDRHLCSSSRSKVQHLTTQRVAAQERIDPDLIFKQNSELLLHEIFANIPSAIQAIKEQRNASGDWRQDTFTHEEEEQYKRDCGFFYKGPSQCYLSSGAPTNGIWVPR